MFFAFIPIFYVLRNFFPQGVYMRIGDNPYTASTYATLETQQMTLESQIAKSGAMSQSDSVIFSSQALSLVSLMSSDESDFSFTGSALSATMPPTLVAGVGATGNNVLAGIEGLLKEFGIDNLEDLAQLEGDEWKERLNEILNGGVNKPSEEGNTYSPKTKPARND